MSSFLYELPTTGAVSFVDFCSDSTGAYTLQLAEATQARANVRAALKESKRTDGEKDNLGLVKILDDYLPHLFAISTCLEQGELLLKTTPIFSWRTTLSASPISSISASPRVAVPTVFAELAFALLTYGFCLSNLARATVAALGAYEAQASLSEIDRKAKDDKLAFAVALLCRASGVFQHVSDVVVGRWEAAVNASPSGTLLQVRPPELTREVPLALSKMALADAQTLAARKLRTKAAVEAAFRPGPPLPRSHPHPALIAKLHLEAAALYTSGRALAKTPAAAVGPGMSSVAGKAKRLFNPGVKSPAMEPADAGGGVGNLGGGEVAPELRRYLADHTALQLALGHMWLGIDAGEGSTGSGGSHMGDAVGYLVWARSELDAIKDGYVKRGVGVGNMSMGEAGDREKDIREVRKEEVKREREVAEMFWGQYRKINDSLSFDPVPSVAELQAQAPAGRLAVAQKVFAPPVPSFGPGSPTYTTSAKDASEGGIPRSMDKTDDTVESAGADAGGNSAPSAGRSKVSYAGAGSYF